MACIKHANWRVRSHNQETIGTLICSSMNGKHDPVLTEGCKAITAKTNARIIVMTIKNTFRPQSFPDGLNHMNRIPENVNAAR